LLKQYSDKGLTEGLWGKVCEAVVSGANWAAQRNVKKISSVVFNIFNTNVQVYINL
jgi:hypothetical protein